MRLGDQILVSFFVDKGLFAPVKDYEYIADTGTAQPISVSKTNYGAREMSIMEKCITALYKLD